jgi:hypothetical protein
MRLNILNFILKGAKFEPYTALQCSGSMTDWYGSAYGSGSSDPYLWHTDPDPALFVIDFQDGNK